MIKPSSTDIKYDKNMMKLLNLNEIEEKIQKSSLKSLALDSIGDTFYKTGIKFQNKGNFKESIKYLKLALVEYRKCLDESNSTSSGILIANLLNDIGVVYQKLNEYNDAFKYYEVSIKSKIKINPNDPTIGHTLSNIGSLFGKKKEFDKGLKYYNDSFSAMSKMLVPNDPFVNETINNIYMINGLPGRVVLFFYSLLLKIQI